MRWAEFKKDLEDFGNMNLMVCSKCREMWDEIYLYFPVDLIKLNGRFHYCMDSIFISENREVWVLFPRGAGVGRISSLCGVGGFGHSLKLNAVSCNDLRMRDSFYLFVFDHYRHLFKRAKVRLLQGTVDFYWWWPDVEDKEFLGRLVSEFFLARVQE